MKIALQVTTATLGDIVVEEADEKTTTNPEDQKAIVVELLIQAITKITAAYKIPKEMLDLETDNENGYQSAHARKVAEDKSPRYSSAEANRMIQNLLVEEEEEKENTCCSGKDRCCGDSSDYNDQGTDGTTEESDEDGLVISEEELEVVQRIILLMRGQN